MAGPPPEKARTRLPASLRWGGLIVGVIALAALLGPILAPFPYDQFHAQDRLKPPGAVYWLGSDEFGRDVLSRTLFGARLSLFMGFLATTISLILGAPLGLLAGYVRGRLDEGIMRIMDLMLSFPPIILGMLVLALTKPGLIKTAAAVGLVYTPSLVRVARSVALDLADREFVSAARARGERTWYILAAEILPNAWPPIIVEASLRVTFAILLGAALCFLGLGAQPPSSDWGLMISEARSFLDVAPWIAVAPGLAMCLTVIGVNLLGDGLREVLDPRLKHGGRG